METFVVLGLCFILYEALDFFQGCIHSAAPSTANQLRESYRRQITAKEDDSLSDSSSTPATPINSNISYAAKTITTKATITGSTISSSNPLINSLDTSIPIPLHNHSSITIRPISIRSTGSPAVTRTTTPILIHKDYQNRNLNFLSKFSSSDNRIFPSTTSLDRVPPGTTTSITLDLKRTIINDEKSYKEFQLSERNRSINSSNSNSYNRISFKDNDKDNGFASSSDENDEIFMPRNNVKKVFSISENLD